MLLICREIKEFLQFILLNTPILWNFIVSLVKILEMYDNPQITKARSVNFKLGIKEFSAELGMWVGISEAIRLFPICINYLFILLKNSFFTFLYTNSLKDINDNNNISLKVNDKKGSGKDNEDRFYEWLAGIIDGDGCF
jgi:hypothetical protein